MVWYHILIYPKPIIFFPLFILRRSHIVGAIHKEDLNALLFDARRVSVVWMFLLSGGAVARAS